MRPYKIMNHPSEWQRIYHPRFGKRVYKHKGTGVITDSLWKIGQVLKKPLVNLAKQTGKKVAEKGIQKASDVAVKKAASAANAATKRAGDKIGSILRSRNTRKTANKPLSSTAKPQPPRTRREEMMQLNNLLSQL